MYSYRVVLVSHVVIQPVAILTTCQFINTEEHRHWCEVRLVLSKRRWSYCSKCRVDENSSTVSSRKRRAYNTYGSTQHSANYIMTVSNAHLQGSTCLRHSIRDSAVRFAGGCSASETIFSRNHSPDLYNTYLDDVEMQGENHQLTNAVPPISRLNSEAVRGRRWTRVFGFPRALCSLFLYVVQKHQCKPNVCERLLEKRAPS